MQNKTLLIVIGGMSRGGAERVLSLIANYFAEKGWNVYIALLLYNEVGYSLNKNIKIINLTFGGGSRLDKLPKWIKFLRKNIKEIKPDVILSFVARIGILTHIASLGLNTKIVISERNDPSKDGRSKIVDFISYIIYPKSKAIVFQTYRASKYFDFLNLTNKYIVPNPISVDCLAKYSVNYRIVTVGRLTEQKNQKMLINAVNSIANKFPEVSLDIYGEGNLKRELKKQIDVLDLSDKVKLKGNVFNIHQEIATASLFVLPSNYEGLSNALLEAMMMGLPCISTKCAGSDEYINNGVNGLLVDIDNQKQMEDAIEYMLSNRNEAIRMGNEARKTSICFEKNKVLDKWYEVITN